MKQSAPRFRVRRTSWLSISDVLSAAVALSSYTLSDLASCRMRGEGKDPVDAGAEVVHAAEMIA